MLFETLKRAVIRKNYKTKQEMEEKIALLYAGQKITDEEYMVLMEMLYEGGE